MLAVVRFNFNMFGGWGVEGGGRVSSAIHIHPYATRFVKFGNFR
jgi:hypothetical protein